MTAKTPRGCSKWPKSRRHPDYARPEELRIDRACALAKRLPKGYLTTGFVSDGMTQMHKVYGEDNRLIATFPGERPSMTPEDFIQLLRMFPLLLTAYRRMTGKVGSLREKVANREVTIYDRDMESSDIIGRLHDNINMRG